MYFSACSGCTLLPATAFMGRIFNLLCLAIVLVTNEETGDEAGALKKEHMPKKERSTLPSEQRK